MNYDKPSLEVLSKVAPALRRKVLAAMDYLAPQGVFFRVAQGLRDNDQQDALYAEGRTAPGHIVTNARAGYSNHNFGCAVDCYPFVSGDAGKLEMDDPSAPVFQKMVHGLSMQGLAWGGLWHHPADCPHFQLSNVPVTPTDADRTLLATSGLQGVWSRTQPCRSGKRRHFMPEDHRSQYIALTLILIATVCIAMGERLHYAQLVSFSLTVGGGGLGILTGQRLQQVNKTESGSINAPQATPATQP